MSYRLWLVLAFLLVNLLLFPRPASTLTPDEVLQLKAAGVSEETIQMMLRNEKEQGIPSDTREQGYATDHMGTWKLRDGRTVTSTGKRQLPLHYPTEYPPPSPYAPYIYPQVGIPSVKAWRRSSPHLPPPSPSGRPFYPHRRE